jgi:hypothetical protein
MILIAHVRSLSMQVARKTGTRDRDTLTQIPLDVPGQTQGRPPGFEQVAPEMPDNARGELQASELRGMVTAEGRTVQRAPEVVLPLAG